MPAMRRLAMVAVVLVTSTVLTAPAVRGTAHEVVGTPVGDLPTPTALHVVPGHLYVTSLVLDAVVRFPILAAGMLGPPEIVASGLEDPLGVAVSDDGVVFVSDSHDGGGAYDERTIGRVRAITAAGIEVVVDGLPNGRHNTNNLVIHGDRLYITNGNSTDDGVDGGDPELPLSGTLLSVPLSTRDLVVGPNGRAVGHLTVEATGMRNLYDVAFRPGTDEAWITINGPDRQDPFGEDTLVKVPDVRRGIPDFGFPNCLYNADGEVGENAVAPGKCTRHHPPEQVLGMHVSANGIAFGPHDPFWSGDIFIAEFGNLFPGAGVVGHAVVRVPIDEFGASSPPQTLVRGITPLDLAFGPAGLYVGDFAAGTITLFRPAT